MLKFEPDLGGIENMHFDFRQYTFYSKVYIVLELQPEDTESSDDHTILGKHLRR